MNIKTVGNQKGFLKSIHYHPYEPTPYNALDILFSEYQLIKSDVVVDFGSGKGRLPFYVNYLFNTTAIGVEFNEVFYHDAVENLNGYLTKYKKRRDRVRFHCGLAEEYIVQPEENRFYFFNPFTVAIFIKVIQNILASAEEVPRTIDLILYYPSGDYVHFLEYQTPFEMVQDVPLPGLAEKNINERFLIYRYSL
ncbi:SAM-dependent methyltransferase [Bacillus sp. FJAT-18017]|uniref:SAM-dependent methyltransferase n=1 Tax=Bacillus sp. FJAT-18017 TaxID=1705566 RepID=UPI0006AFEDC2|nr:SAM-dependent methyltransferase [Bacillus sp. FJAT-18017]ALC92990.1 SAM-dependent methyltransferase [Bacillus sp. FJAT-18017]